MYIVFRLHHNQWNSNRKRNIFDLAFSIDADDDDASVLCVK